MTASDSPLKDSQTVTPAGESLQRLPHGVVFRDAITQVDARGSVCEIFDPRWGWRSDPLVFVYTWTLRPGWVKGWALHRAHEDRYFVLAGELRVVLYDEREDSPTRGLVSEIFLSQYRRRLMNIPAGVWHADHNPGSGDVVAVNFPTVAFDHASPDKYRLPIDTDRIPFRFEGVQGGW
jgi:dTDP-4-dehydrorhamnose 3,5-epimerase